MRKLQQLDEELGLGSEPILCLLRFAQCNILGLSLCASRSPDLLSNMLKREIARYGAKLKFSL
jgi:hypothetical protein